MLSYGLGRPRRERQETTAKGQRRSPKRIADAKSKGQCLGLVFWCVDSSRWVTCRVRSAWSAGITDDAGRDRAQSRYPVSGARGKLGRWDEAMNMVESIRGVRLATGRDCAESVVCVPRRGTRKPPVVLFARALVIAKEP